MANITRLTEILWTGGDLPEDEEVAADHIGDWRDAGIGTVIDCRFEWSDEDLVRAIAPEIHYVQVGIDDAGQRIPPAWFDEVLAAASTAADDGGGVLVHCHMGINRGPSAAYALLLADGHDPVGAIDLIRTRRPIAAVDYRGGQRCGGGTAAAAPRSPNGAPIGTPWRSGDANIPTTRSESSRPSRPATRGVTRTKAVRRGFLGQPSPTCDCQRSSRSSSTPSGTRTPEP